MLVSQGWAPGTLLGATNAPHAHLHSGASASHIRVTFREDNLGLGAKHGSGQGAGECTGLDNFQDLLGRLNGKSETQLEKEQESRNDLKRTLYTERRWGTLRFVSGGLLIGDKITELVDREKLRVAAKSSAEESYPTLLDEEVDRTKREEKSEAHQHVDNTKAQSVRKSILSIDSATAPGSLLVAPTAGAESNEGRADTKQGAKAARVAKKARKEGRMQRKLDRRKRKEAGKGVALVEPEASPEKSLIHSALTEIVQPVPERSLQLSNHSTAASTPSISGTATPTSIGGRHLVRQRYIMQKRRAVMDPKALNEVRDILSAYPTVMLI